MEINPISIAYLPGIVQGLILLVATNLNKNRRSTANRLLNLLIISITLLLVHHGLVVNGQMQGLQFFQGLAAVFWFAISPLLYLYVKALIDPEFRFRAWHLALLAVPIYNFVSWGLHLAGLRIGFYLIFNDIDAYTYAWIANYLLTSMGFTIASLIDIRRANLHKKHLGKLKWLKWYFYAFIAVLVATIALLYFVISIQEYTDDFEFSLLIVYEIFVFVLVFKSIYFSNYLTHISNDTYRHASKNKGELKSRYEQLRTHMETQRPYLNKDLGLAALSGQSGIPENTLSQIFNQYLKTNFYEFVNGYRLQAIEKMILDPAKKQYKIASLAEECGFSSKTSFYKAFKQKHQMTPTEYVRSHS